jgi:hypothetical protein
MPDDAKRTACYCICHGNTDSRVLCAHCTFPDREPEFFRDSLGRWRTWAPVVVGVSFSLGYLSGWWFA